MTTQTSKCPCPSTQFWRLVAILFLLLFLLVQRAVPPSLPVIPLHITPPNAAYDVQVAYPADLHRDESILITVYFRYPHPQCNGAPVSAVNLMLSLRTVTGELEVSDPMIVQETLAVDPNTGVVSVTRYWVLQPKRAGGFDLIFEVAASTCASVLYQAAGILRLQVLTETGLEPWLDTLLKLLIPPLVTALIALTGWLGKKWFEKKRR